MTNSSGKSLPSVIVKAISGDSREWHTRTGKEGRFSLVIPDCPDTLTLRFSKLGYETESMIVTDYATPISAQLLPASSTLREVTVTAPEVRLKGDTIIYNLADFAGKGDVTLQDALKKVPGIEVEDNGGIKYNGKSISNFYINGMDLLGGKYNLATTGIPHSYVSAVEILNNHQNKKIDRKIFSDNVALNIKLKKKAMFKPMGKYVVKAGTGSKWMGEAAGAGMMFRDDFQTILTLKGGNVNEFASYDNMVHYHYDKNGSGGSYAEKIMGNLFFLFSSIGKKQMDKTDRRIHYIEFHQQAFRRRHHTNKHQLRICTLRLSLLGVGVILRRRFRPRNRHVNVSFGSVAQTLFLNRIQA